MAGIGDHDGRIPQLILGVSIALGNADMTACEPMDADGNGTCDINELIQAVNAALNGCAG